MPGGPSRLTRFWNELKRRRVVHVIVVYASAAFVIIELIGNVTGPLNLPSWTPTLVIVLLAAGFPLAVIFSWIFDVTPEGIEKTKPPEGTAPEGTAPEGTNRRKNPLPFFHSRTSVQTLTRSICALD